MLKEVFDEQLKDKETEIEEKKLCFQERMIIRLVAESVKEQVVEENPFKDVPDESVSAIEKEETEQKVYLDEDGELSDDSDL